MPKRFRLRRAPAGLLEVVVTMSNKHVKSQIVSKKDRLVILSASTVEQEISRRLHGPEEERPADWKPTYITGSVQAAKVVGDCLGERATSRGIHEVIWNNQASYTGKMKAFIDAFRERGVKTR